ncbi:TPA: ESPR domain-containing protein, partial [Burkholderia cepacia]|nr:ESPR domain-containing protein [Burkholderia cepacia]
MNNVYRTVWNESIGAWVAASENAKARGKRGSFKKLALVTALTPVLISGLSENAHAQYSVAGGTASGGSSIAISGNAPSGGSKALSNGSLAIGVSGTTAGSTNPSASGEVA